MIINLKEISYYYLTCNNEVRKNHIIKEFEDLNLIEVNPITNIPKFMSACTGFSKIFDLAALKQDRTKPFQPFVILEDDVKKFREFPLNISAPDDTDILYVGLSNEGLSCVGLNEKGEELLTNCPTVCLKNIDNNIIRIFNMLSTHGLMVCSIRGLLAIQKSIFEDYFKNSPWDLSLTQLQPYLNIYALKEPLVYQYGKIGGLEKQTKINYLKKKDYPMVEKWINKKNITILTTNTSNN